MLFRSEFHGSLGEDVEAIKARTNDLAQASMKLGEALYRSQGAGGPSAEGAQSGGKDDVIDADFKEVGPDDKKRSA